MYIDSASRCCRIKPLLSIDYLLKFTSVKCLNITLSSFVQIKRTCILQKFCDDLFVFFETHGSNLLTFRMLGSRQGFQLFINIFARLFFVLFQSCFNLLIMRFDFFLRLNYCLNSFIFHYFIYWQLICKDRLGA